MNRNDDALERLLLERIRVAATQRFASDVGPGVGAAARLSIEADRVAGLLVAAAFDFLGQRTAPRTFEWPATWWDAVKARWCPAWLRLRPVRMRRVTVHAQALCPQLPVATFVPPADRGRVATEVGRIAAREAALGPVAWSAAAEARRTEQAEQVYRRTHLVQLAVEEDVVEIE